MTCLSVGSGLIQTTRATAFVPLLLVSSRSHRFKSSRHVQLLSVLLPIIRSYKIIRRAHFENEAHVPSSCEWRQQRPVIVSHDVPSYSKLSRKRWHIPTERAFKFDYGSAASPNTERGRGLCTKHFNEHTITKAFHTQKRLKKTHQRFTRSWKSHKPVGIIEVWKHCYRIQFRGDVRKARLQFQWIWSNT